ncbi:MAG: hypothetical protein WC705_00685 [Candidatus Paceibacterota bacterium]|jgi:hypothetical protein
MTVIEFGKKDLKINFMMSVFVVFIAVSVVFGVFLYNKLIGIRHDLSQTQDSFEKSQVRNVELKNQLYQILDSFSGESFLESRGLVSDKNPSYIKNALEVSKAD